MKNRYEINGKLTWVWMGGIRSKDHLIGMVDTADLPKMMAYPGTWHADWRPTSNTHYVRASSDMYLHRFLTDAGQGIEVDHKNHNGLDNRRENLHVVTRFENQQNRQGARRGSKSGIRNVIWVESKQRWLAKLYRYGKPIQLGHHVTKEAAEQQVQDYLLSEVAK